MTTRIGAGQLVGLLAGWRARQMGPSPTYRRLAERLRLLLLDGRLPIGGVLPAERELARRLAVSRTTVTGAYNHLRELGFLERLQGSGSYTRLPHGRDADLPDDDAGIDFTSAATPASPGLYEATQQALTMFPEYLTSTGYDIRGLPELRRAIAERYTERGLTTTADQVLVTLGAHHASSLLMRTFVSRGDRVLVESPGFPQSFDAARAAGARLLTTPVTPAGWDHDALLTTVGTGRPALAYLMPDFHNPTGSSMPSDQRADLLSMTNHTGTTVIADETTAELAIDEDAWNPPLAAHGPAILIGSVGKTMWGGLRIGWIRAAPATITRIVRSRRSTDLGTPILEQLIATALLRDYASVLAAMRSRLQAARELVYVELRRRFPTWHVPWIRGGHTVWAGLGRPVSSALSIQAGHNGLRIPPGPRFSPDGAFERFLRVPITFDEQVTIRALDLLETSWQQVIGGRDVPVSADADPPVI